MSSRIFWVGGNWKLNAGTTAAANQLVGDVAKGASELEGNAQVEVVVAPPATVLSAVARAVAERPGFTVAAQNCFHESSGAFTGEISAEMVKDTGATWVILGHSERRSIFKESDELIAQKITAALKTGLRVCACIGETLEQRESGSTNEVVAEQTAAILRAVGDVGADAFANVVLAYEPVWAIGTGRVATPQQAEDVHAHLREFVAEKSGKDVAERLRIVYGGSVKPNNCEELAGQPNVDGFLVGGASLVGSDFVAIIASAQVHAKKS